MKIKENIHQWCPFWTASAVKDFMFRMKKSRMFAGINRRKKSKKEFLFSVITIWTKESLVCDIFP
jgi:hypothetical protein